MRVLPSDPPIGLAGKFVGFLGMVWATASLCLGQCPDNPIFTPTSWSDHNGSATSGSPYTVVGQGSNSAGQFSESGYADLTTGVGNGQILAEVVAITGTMSTGSAAGIFIRSDVTPGSDGPLLWIDGPLSQFYQFDARINDGGLTEIQSDSCVLPYWLRLQNSGNVFYPSVSTNGSSWAALPALDLSSDPRFSAGTTLAYGLFAWSGSNSGSTTAVFDNLCFNDSFTPYPTLTPAMTPTSTLTPNTTPTPSPTPTVSPSLTPTMTGSPLLTATWTPSPTLTDTPLTSNYPTPTPTPGLKVWPNPFTPQLPSNNTAHFSLPSSHGSGSVLIADLWRRQVRSVHFQAGVDVQWDGRDNNGNIVTSGVYLYLLESDGGVSRGTVTVMR